MNKPHFVILTLLSGASVLLGGCSNVRSSLGLDKAAPDEFAVIKRAPLEIPSQVALPPPVPGMPRPQETSVLTQAEKAVLGEEKVFTQETSSAEDLLLQKTGADQANPNIRAQVNKETANLDERNEPVMKKLLKLGGGDAQNSATVVDAKKEYERIKKNQEEGRAITDGETPVIEE